MIGKALYDGIQFDAQFALFFLRSCVGHQNYLDDLQGLDAQIYSSLMKLKSMTDPEEIESMGLTFAVDTRVYGSVRSVELVPGGASLAVTSENKMRFLYLMSDWYLNKQMARQANAFQRGMWSLVPPQWLRMFAADELRLLLSGSPRVNLADLQAHTTYSSGYSANHEVIQWFWSILHEATPEQIGLFLRFCTSCSRAPLLGFGFLQPGFCIQRVNADEHEQNLPTAATCMNLLRLPRYGSRERLKEKLLYAITAASTGFGLT
jgi:ubiquitin-protein ligase E3 C